MSFVNQYPLWKNLLILAVFVGGVLTALPNAFGDDPAVQVSHPSIAVDAQPTIARVEAALAAAGIAARGVALEDGQVIARFDDPEVQLRAMEAVKAALDDKHGVALNLAARTPQWLRDLGLKPMNLGLDLRGGVHFLLQVDMKAALNQALERYEGDARTTLRGKDVRYLSVSRDGETVVVRFRDAEGLAAGSKLLAGEFPDVTLVEESTDTEHALRLSLSEFQLRAIRDAAVQQNVVTLRNRVNELGVAEPLVQQQGAERIVVQLPGVQDTVAARDILGATATLEFRLVSEEGNAFEAAESGRVPINAKLYRMRDGTPILLKREVIVRGDQLTDANATIDQETGTPAVSVRLDAAGGRRMGDTTAANVGKPMAIVYIENKSITRTGPDGQPVIERRRVEEVVSAPTIQGVFSSSFQVTGLDQAEARQLSLLLRAGALAAPVDVVEDGTIGPSLGADNISKGFMASLIGFLLCCGFATVYYRLFGLVASLALAFNLVMIVALMSVIQATLTLPGIAGIVLTVGMAVDANVLIYERIREELRKGTTPQAAISAGYDRAFVTIADSNFTTLIAGVVLFGLGSGPIKGFAVTLCLGIVTSMFTAIMGTRAIINLVYGGRRVAALSI